MFRSSRHATVFAAGLLLGIVAGASVLSGLRDQPPVQQAVAPAPASQAAGCAYDPLLAAAPQQDGKFAAPMDGAGKVKADVAAYIAVGDDAATQGRIRDAEIAYITACRIAGQLAGVESPELADAKYHLATHYTRFALKGPVREPAFKRAETLFSESVAAYGSKLGITDQKTALAASGLASVKAAMAVPDEALGVPAVLLAERTSPDYGVTMVNTAAIAAAAARKKKAAEEEAQQAQETVAVQAQPQPPQPVNVPACLGGDCPTGPREPVLRMQVTREMGGAPAPAEPPPVRLSPPTKAMEPPRPAPNYGDQSAP